MRRTRITFGVITTCSPRTVVEVALRAFPRERDLVADPNPYQSPEANQSLDFVQFLRMLDNTKELAGIRVVFYDGFTMNVIREGPPLCGRDVRAIIIKPDIGEYTIRNAEFAAAHEGKVYTELLNTGLGCGGAVVSWLVVGGAAGAVPLTGGTSLIIEKLAVPSAIIGTISCGNSGYRLYNEI